MSLSSDYSHHMRHHSSGYALYHPQYDSAIKPGSCGYFDAAGNWTLIANIPEIDKKDERKFSLINTRLLEKADSIKQSWGPKYSLGVKAKTLDLKFKTTLPAGIPPSVKAVCEYESNKNFGAVLLTVPFVMRDAYSHKSPFRSWESKNAQLILSLYPEVRDHGFWIITGTWTTPECSLTAWKNQAEKVSVGFGAGVSGAAEIDTTAGWYAGASSGGWTNMKGENGKRVVVFVQGDKYSYDWLRRLHLHGDAEFRGPNDEPSKESDDEASMWPSDDSDAPNELERALQDKDGSLALYRVSWETWK